MRGRRNRGSRFLAGLANIAPRISKEPLFRHFSSIAEYGELQESPANIGKASSSGHSVSWFGVPTRAEALNICKTGTWAAGMKRFEELTGFDIPAAQSIKRRNEWSNQGNSLDIHRVYSGNLDRAWQRTVRRNVHSSPTIVISFPLIFSSFTSSDEIFYCGAAALKLTELLTVAGYNVMIIGTHGTTGTNGDTGYDSVVVKDAGAPLDVEACLISMAFAGFARTVGFVGICSNPFPVSEGLGYAHYDPREPLDVLRLPSTNVIRDLYTSVNSKVTAIAWIQKQLDKLQAAVAA